MKKLFIAFITLVLFVSCENRKAEISKTKIKDIVNHVYEFEYKDHDYIMFKDARGNLTTAGVVHSPDCRCGMKE